MTYQRYFVIDARRNVINLISFQINTMSKISIGKTVKIVVTEEAVVEEEILMGAAGAAVKRVTRIMVVGTTHIMRAKVHHGVRNI